MLIYKMYPRCALAILMLCAGASAQEALTLSQAVKMALRQHPSMEVAKAGVDGAEERIKQARSGRLPKLDYSESFRRSNNPVFVFGSLLTQHQFTASNFALDTLNRPDALNNFQSQLSVEQMLFDGNRTQSAVRAAESMRSVAGVRRQLTEMDRIASVVRAYYAAALAQESTFAAQEAVKSADADLKKANDIRQAGMSTDADVLAIRVHLASVREQEIRRRYELEVAVSALNEALGEPLETPRQLAAEKEFHEPGEGMVGDTKAAGSHPYTALARFSAEAAGAETRQARAALLPRVSAFSMFEADRQNFVTKGGANWTAGVSFQWNLFSGFADRSRIAEASAAEHAARALVKQRNAETELMIRRASAEWKASAERVSVAGSTVQMAEESLRITRNRYEAGLASVTDLLSKETALVEARMRLLAARYDRKLSAVSLEYAAGSLTENSDVLK